MTSTDSADFGLPGNFDNDIEIKGPVVEEGEQAPVPSLLSLTYKHDHDCHWKDEEVVVNPSCRGSVAYANVPICLETLGALTVVKVEKK